MPFCSKTKLPSASTAPRDWTPSRSRSKLQWPFLTLEGCSPLQPRNQSRPNHWLHAFLRQNKAPLGLHGAGGPDALQVPIKAPMAVSDLGGLQSLAAAEPIKAQPLAPCLFAAKQSSPRPARAGGPDALQVPIKAPMAVFDLEGYGPSQPRNQ